MGKDGLSMDARTNMIIAKGKPISSDVISCDLTVLLASGILPSKMARPSTTMRRM